MPDIQVILTPGELNKFDLKNKNVVIIDTLRTGTTIITALASGIDCVYPFNKLSNLLSFYNKKRNKNKYICVGEEDGRKVKGFDFGNSPLCFVNGRFKNKIMLLKANDGATVLNRFSKANIVLIGSLINSSKVVAEIISRGQDVFLVCTGSNGSFSLEDFFTAGRYCYLLKKSGWSGDDLTTAAGRIYEDNSQYSEIVNLFYHSKNGQDLRDLGYEQDIKFSSRVDTIDIVPVFDGLKISVKKLYYEEAFLLGV